MRRKGGAVVSGGANVPPVDSEPESRAEAVNEAHNETSPQSAPSLNVNAAEGSSPLEQSSQQASMNVSQARGENIRKLHESWANQAPIAVKPIRKASSVVESNVNTQFNQAPSYVKRALPGLVNNNDDKGAIVSPPSPPPTPPLVVRTESSTPSRPPQSPRHSRIPSTGSRPTVMDVAQAFSAAAASSGNSPASPVLTSPRSPPPMQTQRAQAPQEPQMRATMYDPERDPGGWGEPDTNERTITPAMLKAERRRSNYEKYANFVLPVLKEEKTPAPSPVQTLKEKDIAGSAVAVEIVDENAKEALDSEKSVEELIADTEASGEEKMTKVHIGE